MTALTAPRHPEVAPQLSAEDMAHHAEQAAQFLKLLANPHRLMILCHLSDGEVCVSDLNRHLPLSQSALSQHLAVLRHSGLVTTRRHKQTIFYSLAGAEVTAIIQVLYAQFCQGSGSAASSHE
jgi:DNA-binding transcriptional ArsR family regulator